MGEGYGSLPTRWLAEVGWGCALGYTRRMKKPTPPGAIERGRQLRRDATPAERAMWRLLREMFPEAWFRRQVRLGHYFADFCSHRMKLVVEVDGGQHSPEIDARRTAAIEAEGYRVIRFWNSDVLGNREGVATLLAQALRDHPHPASTRRQAAKSSHPSPIEGEEK